MLGFKGVLIRTSTERPEVLDKGTIVIGGIKTEDIEQAIDLVVQSEPGTDCSLVSDYKDENVSMKVVKIIQSYTKIVNKVVWDK